MRLVPASAVLCLVLAGCAAGPFAGAGRPAAPSPSAEAPRPVALPPPAARTAEALDTTSPAERAAAAAPAAGGRLLGRSLASLGDPGQPGFWIATPLVASTAPGRVAHAPTGAMVRLELRASGGAPGAGSQLSLAAFRALDLPLTALPELEVWAE